ncbi:hypothetical protein CCUS01_06868 [Colletotrichum cuscutae]|uniref:Uncharacterized protein n=1 Tax=Colletotrichum cuscutae TaxID=1209917 RepID=A0AAI9V582_9PEZI|nr:hypothetical protein CCUS01_06868 [Colletotrichum cuscutae]
MYVPTYLCDMHDGNPSGTNMRFGPLPSCSQPHRAAARWTIGQCQSDSHYFSC